MIRFVKSRTTLGVRDVSVSIDFYERVLGFETIVTMGDPPDFALMGGGETGLGLAQTEHPSVARFACCYFNVEDVEGLHQRCVDAGRSSPVP